MKIKALLGKFFFQKTVTAWVVTKSYSSGDITNARQELVDNFLKNLTGYMPKYYL